MPFIEVKTSVALDQEKKNRLKERLGKDICLIPGKSEGVTMIGLVGSYNLFFGGVALEKGAYVEVKLFKSTTREAMKRLNSAICETLEVVLEVPKEGVYITFHGQPEWGAKGELL